MAERTELHRIAVEGAQMRAAAGTLRLGPQEAVMSPGERTFRSICAGCHARDTRLVGPPLIEIAQAYPGDPAGIAAWVRAPGRKRMDYPEMPPIKLTDDQYRAVAEWVLEVGSGT
jgi:cytochrome c